MKSGKELILTRWLFSTKPTAVSAPQEPNWAQDALDLVHQALVIIDANGIVRQVNQSACDILGYAEQDMLGQSCLLVAPPEIRVQGERFIAGLLRGSQKIKSHWVLRHKLGAYLTVTADFKARHSAAWGACVLIVFSLDDKSDPIDLARRAQNARDASHLALSYGMLHQVINSIPARIAYFGSQTRQCIFGNEAFAEWHEQPIKMLHGKTICQLLHPRAWADVRDYFEQAAKGQRCQFDHIDTDLVGASRYYQCELLPHFAHGGEQIGIFALFVDITSHHQTEQALRASEERLHRALATEKELGELKTAFVAMASHELRTPLTTIQSVSDLLMHYGDRMTSTDRSESLTEIQDAVQRMVSIMENILILGRIGHGGTESLTQVDMTVLCEDLSHEIARAYPRQNAIEVHTDPHDAHALLRLDEASLRHILGNLLSNACKYSSPDCPVVLAWHKEGTGDSAALCISVTDRGIGIPPEHLPRLFESFRRAPNVGKIPGTGLGLPIVKRAIDSMGGSISVVSDVGLTRFDVRLPWQE